MPFAAADAISGLLLLFGRRTATKYGAHGGGVVVNYFILYLFLFREEVCRVFNRQRRRQRQGIECDNPEYFHACKGSPTININQYKRAGRAFRLSSACSGRIAKTTTKRSVLYK